jgi:hypothetical protein
VVFSEATDESVILFGQGVPERTLHPPICPALGHTHGRGFLLAGSRQAIAHRHSGPLPLFDEHIITRLLFGLHCFTASFRQWPALRMELQSSADVITMAVAPCS